MRRRRFFIDFPASQKVHDGYGQEDECQDADQEKIDCAENIGKIIVMSHRKGSPWN